MPLRIGNVTLDCEDVLEVARFWSAALGRPLDSVSGPDFASIGGDDAARADPRGTSRRSRSPKWPRIACTLTWWTPTMAQ